MNSEKQIVKCMYCGADIERLHSNSSYDFGLHKNEGTYGIDDDDEHACCSYCNTITIVNRAFNSMIEHPESLDLSLIHIRGAIDYLDSNKAKIMKYYMKQKQSRDSRQCL